MKIWCSNVVHLRTPTRAAEIPKAKWNEASYLEVLTKSFPKWGEGGATQFITKSEIKISKLRNLKTGEVIDFAK